MSNLAARQAARRERVISAVLELASEGGYEGVQMRDVAAKADVALGTLYRYFLSKDHLLLAALSEWVADIERDLVVCPARGSTAADRVVDVLGRVTSKIENAPTLAAALIPGLISPERPMEGVPQESADVVLSIRAMIETAIGEADVEDRDQIIYVLGLAWFGLLIRWTGGTLSTQRMGKDLEMSARLLLR